MLDLKYFRENIDDIRARLATKKFQVDLDGVLALDAERRAIIRQAEELRATQNAANDAMAKMPKGTPEFKAKIAEMKELSTKVKELQEAQKKADEEFQKAYLTIPNVPHPTVPVGRTEEDNVVAHTWGDVTAVSPHARPHWEIPRFPQWVDLERGTKVTGSGFPFYMGDMARLVRSLLQFFLNEDSAAGFVEVMPPVVVNPASATATGQLPDKEAQMYHAPLDDFYLVPTAEVPVTNYYRDEIVDAALLPLKACAYTPCFRREAGSYGKDVRGLNRLHQFDKVELVAWSHPDTSFDELERLRGQVESLIEKLGLPYRTLRMCTGDIGFSHSKQYDMEVWAAGQKRWLEVSSCSNFTDFQARRANIRFRDKDGTLRVCHTLNASGLAVPRVLAAILENNVQEDGSVIIPEVLRPYFGKDRIR